MSRGQLWGIRHISPAIDKEVEQTWACQKYTLKLCGDTVERWVMRGERWALYIHTSTHTTHQRKTSHLPKKCKSISIYSIYFISTDKCHTIVQVLRMRGLFYQSPYGIVCATADFTNPLISLMINDQVRNLCTASLVLWRWEGGEVYK